MSKRQIRNSTAEFLIFTAQNDEGAIEVRYGKQYLPSFFRSHAPAWERGIKAANGPE